MRVTITSIKADIGSIGGHITPSKNVIDRVTKYIENEGKGLIIDYYIGFTGDDIAILLSHKNGICS